MKIIGTGVDLVEVSRFEKAARRHGERFLKRLFTPSEMRYASQRKTMMQHLAARFAAKEAVVKALGAPKGLGLKWKDLEVTRSKSGKPGVLFRGSMSRWKKRTVHLSLTHTHEHAIATAIVL
jgi:holo-[acyl-carrier protein] synthase